MKLSLSLPIAIALFTTSVVQVQTSNSQIGDSEKDDSSRKIIPFTSLREKALVRYVEHTDKLTHNSPLSLPNSNNDSKPVEIIFNVDPNILAKIGNFSLKPSLQTALYETQNLPHQVELERSPLPFALSGDGNNLSNQEHIEKHVSINGLEKLSEPSLEEKVEATQPLDFSDEDDSDKDATPLPDEEIRVHRFSRPSLDEILESPILDFTPFGRTPIHGLATNFSRGPLASSPNNENNSGKKEPYVKEPSENIKVLLKQIGLMDLTQMNKFENGAEIQRLLKRAKELYLDLTKSHLKLKEIADKVKLTLDSSNRDPYSIQLLHYSVEKHVRCAINLQTCYTNTMETISNKYAYFFRPPFLIRYNIVLEMSKSELIDGIASLEKIEKDYLKSMNELEKLNDSIQKKSIGKEN